LIPQGRHTIRDYTRDMDFAAKHLLDEVGPPYGLVWSDLDKGTGIVAIVGEAKGQPVLRLFRMRSEVAPSSTPVDEEHSEVRMNGRVVSPPEPCGQILLDAPQAEPPHGKADIREAFAFLRQALPGWKVAWCRMGTTWPVAVLHRKVADADRWLFIQVPSARYGTMQRAVVELSLDGDDLKAAMRAARPRPQAY